jgi:DNA-binding NarL/FixJ family response regulator
MDDETKTAKPLPATPWGLLPPALRVLHITSPRRTGAWLAEAFASDSACAVTVSEVYGAAAGAAELRERVFDAVLVSHEPAELDALELVDALRAGGGDESVVILGDGREQEMAALAYEVGADAYVCASTTTTRTLLWVVARATERRALLRENRRLAQAERHRREQESGEAERLLSEQRDLVRDSQCRAGDIGSVTPDALAALEDGADLGSELRLGEPLVNHYRQLLKAHVIMGSGNLSAEMIELAEQLASEGVTAPQTLRLHVQVLEELVRGIGNRGARHVMTRGDLLVLEVLVHLSERYRLRCQMAGSASVA